MDLYTKRERVNPNHIKSLKVVTPRLRRLVDEWEQAAPQVTADSSVLFTQAWLANEHEPLDIRWAKAYANILTKTPVVIWDGELIVGNQTKVHKGVDVIAAFMPEGIKAQLESKNFNRQMSVNAAGIDEDDEAKLMADCEYWCGHILPEYEKLAIEANFDEAHLASLDDTGTVIEGPLPKARPLRGGIASMFGITPDPHISVMNTGLNTIISKAQAAIDELMENGADLGVTNDEGYKKILLWRAMIISCQAVIEWAGRYAVLAAEKAAAETDPVRKAELEKIAETCTRVPAEPPRDYWEALQSLRFIHLAIRKEVPQRVQVTLGRMDQYLYPYYKKDLESGALTRQQAAEMLGCFWLKTREGEAVAINPPGREAGATPGSLLVHATIGGRDEQGRDVTNEVSWLILEVMRQLRLSEPSVYIRYHAEMDDEFLLFALECNRDFRGGSPAFLNDAMGTNRNLARGVKLEDAVNWYASGCLGYNLDSVERSAGATNLNQAKILELALNDGFDRRQNKQLGPHTGNAAEFKSLEDVYTAFFTQMDHFAERQRKDYFIRRSVQTMITPRSGIGAAMLFEDSLKTGRAQFEGGARYPDFNQWWMGDRGLTDVADSLASIQTLVFDQKKLTMQQLLDAMNANWEGFEDVHQLCLKVTKYGNDNALVDDIHSYIMEKAQTILEKRPDPFTGRKPFLYKGAAAGHIIMGKVVRALPNGRKDYIPLNDSGLSAMPGMDTNGPSAMIKSATKYASGWEEAGCVLNMKFPVHLLDSREKLEAVLKLTKEFFARGGWHIQYNILDPQELIEAKKHPEQYSHIVVRISGFCAYFVDLPESLQDEIIGRTLHQV